MARIDELVREITIGDEKAVVAVGDTIWWFQMNAIDKVPIIATLLRFCEDNKVDLAYHSSAGTRLVNVTGVCLMSDLDLNNPNHRKKGSWCPRICWTMLNIKY